MDNGWKVDNEGRRYREIAPGHIEFEPTIVVDGIEIYQSDLEEFHRRQKEQEARRKAATLDEFKNRPPTKYCPFNSSMNNQCKREGCVLFLNGGCSLAIIADATGAEIEEAPARDKKCPFSIYGHCENCALYSKGCAIVRIATATNNK